MRNDGFRYVYGPVPSRRLGRSLGIDLIPFKTCTYDCIYCQLGRTTNKTIERKEYVPVDGVMSELKIKLAQSENADYISLAGSGEPTLHSGIGDLIRRIKELTRIPVAVLTNGSLLWMPEVRNAVMPADLVIPSLDCGDERIYRYVNRPHTAISFPLMKEGILEFIKVFPGKVWLEVFLLAGVTGIDSEAKKIAGIVKNSGADRIQLNTVTRPPAEDFALPVSRKDMRTLKKIFGKKAEIVSESVINYLKPALMRSRTEEDILALITRRPCTAGDLADGLGLNMNEIIKYLNTLIGSNKITITVTDDKRFYVINRPIEKV